MYDFSSVMNVTMAMRGGFGGSGGGASGGGASGGEGSSAGGGGGGGGGASSLGAGGAGGPSAGIGSPKGIPELRCQPNHTKNPRPRMMEGLSFSDLTSMTEMGKSP